jgi:queuine tRNA-ribosyltransferase
VTPGFGFRVVAEDGRARRSVLSTPHGEVELPTFMPVGTQGSVKTLEPGEVSSTGARIVLGNTYHLMLRPGAETIAKLGGLHAFTRWPHAMLTDSGGFQAFSLAAGKSLVTPSEDGFTFRSHLDGTKYHLSPEEAVRVQGLIGADIQMQLDVCPPGESPRAVVEAAVAQTTRWAKRALAAPRPPHQALFGIVQGACFADLRASHADELGALSDSRSGLSSTASPSAASRSASRSRAWWRRCTRSLTAWIRADRATSWAWARRTICSRRSTRASTCSTACSPRATRATVRRSGASARS